MSVYFTEEAEKNLREIKRNSSDRAYEIMQEISTLSRHSHDHFLDSPRTREERILVLRVDDYRIFYTISDQDIYVLGLANKSNNSFKPKPLRGST